MDKASEFQLPTGFIMNKTRWSATFDFAYVRSINGVPQVAKPLEFETWDLNSVMPTFTLWPNEVQRIFNELWDAGFRPTDGTGNSGHVAALERHLTDMRLLAFHVLDISKEEKEK